MTFHQLEYFIAVAKYLNFSIAAEEVFSSQSTLSNQIKKLEDELGVFLFVRGSRSVRLTPAGDDFLVHARRIVAEVSLSKENMEEYTNYQKGHIRIGLVPSASYLGIHKYLAEFLHTYSHLEFHFFFDNTEALLRGIREKKTMLAFVSAPFSEEYSVNFYPILKENLVLLVSTNSRFAKRQEVSISEVEKESFLLSNDSRYYLNDMYATHGINLKTIGDCNNMNMVRSFVEEEISVALIGEYTAKKLVSEKIAAIPLVEKYEHTHGLAIPKQKRSPLSTKALRDFILLKTGAPPAEDEPDDED
jgi:DNA-binding transcriptional LysR family regulator